MIEKIKLTGRVRGVSNPFDFKEKEAGLLIIDSDRGYTSIPVKNIHDYQFFQRVNISVIIEADENE